MPAWIPAQRDDDQWLYLAAIKKIGEPMAALWVRVREETSRTSL